MYICICTYVTHTIYAIYIHLYPYLLLRRRRRADHAHVGREVLRKKIQLLRVHRDEEQGARVGPDTERLVDSIRWRSTTTAAATTTTTTGTSTSTSTSTSTRTSSTTTTSTTTILTTSTTAAASTISTTTTTPTNATTNASSSHLSTAVCVCVCVVVGGCCSLSLSLCVCVCDLLIFLPVHGEPHTLRSIRPLRRRHRITHMHPERDATASQLRLCHKLVHAAQQLCVWP